MTVVTGVTTTSGRSWGRAGVLVGTLLLAAACSSAPASTIASRESRGAAAVAAPGLPGPTDVATGDEVIAPPPDDFAGAVASAPAPDLPETAARGTGIWSVVIGIDDYPGSGHDLQFARNDAADLDAVLDRAGEPSSQRVDLVDGQATAATIHRALRWLVAHSGPDATAVLFYAGHVRKLSSTTEAIVGADGALVTDAAMADDLRDLHAAHTWIVIAGCYGGGFTELLAPGRILTAASSADQLAYETATYHRSYLGEYLVHRGMLEGLGGPSVQSAFTYAADALRSEHPDRMPVEFDDASGPLVLGGFPAPPPPAPPPTTTTTTAAPSRPSSAASPPSAQPQNHPNPKQRCIVTAGSLVGCPDD